MTSFKSIPLLKRTARLLARESGISLAAALDKVAASRGWSSWSLLAARAAEGGAARAFHARLAPGDLALVGARPGQGKTLMGLRIALEAAHAGHASTFFTLEYAESDMRNRLNAIGATPEAAASSFRFDMSEAISADHVAASLSSKIPGTLAVIDYMQILDQNRNKPSLMEQVRSLHAFTRRTGAIVVMISQIDRGYDPTAKPFPDFSDIRLPNPIDLSLFDKACFLNAGNARFHDRAPSASDW